MHGGFNDIRTVRDLPWVARHAAVKRDAVLRRLSIPSGKPLAMSSFGGYGVRDLDLATLDCLGTWTVVITGRERPPDLPDGVSFVDENAIYAAGVRYQDLVAACDVVVTKPGYGIISECLANDTALLYTSRGHFVEYDAMGYAKCPASSGACTSIKSHCSPAAGRSRWTRCSSHQLRRASADQRS